MSLKRSLSRVEPLPTLLILAFAIPFLWIGASEARDAQIKTARYAVAEGIVVDNNLLGSQDLEDSSHETWAFYPVVTFTTGDGDLVTFTDGVGTFPPEYEEGERVEVLYDPQNPHDATINSWKRIWMGPIWVMAIGLLPVLAWTGWLLWRCLVSRRGLPTPLSREGFTCRSSLMNVTCNPNLNAVLSTQTPKSTLRCSQTTHSPPKSLSRRAAFPTHRTRMYPFGSTSGHHGEQA